VTGRWKLDVYLDMGRGEIVEYRPSTNAGFSRARPKAAIRTKIGAEPYEEQRVPNCVSIFSEPPHLENGSGIGLTRSGASRNSADSYEEEVLGNNRNS